MDALLLEQHLRSPLRLFPDPMLAQFMPQDADSASAAILEKARQHLQMWGRSPYTELLLPQMYQRPNINAALNLGLWQGNLGQWSPQLSAAAGFLNNQAALQQAAAAAQQQQQHQARSPPPGPMSTPSSSGSPSPDVRSKHFVPRFSPYQIVPAPQTQTTNQNSTVSVAQSSQLPLSPQSPAPERSPSN
jgi:T-box protein 20